MGAASGWRAEAAKQSRVKRGFEARNSTGIYSGEAGHGWKVGKSQTKLELNYLCVPSNANPSRAVSVREELCWNAAAKEVQDALSSVSLL